MGIMSTEGSIVLTRFSRLGVRVDTYKTFEEMLEDLLTNSGEETPLLVRDTLLPKAIKAWEDAKREENEPTSD